MRFFESESEALDQTKETGGNVYSITIDGIAESGGPLRRTRWFIADSDAEANEIGGWILHYALTTGVDTSNVDFRPEKGGNA